VNAALGDTWAVVVNWNGGQQNLACLRSLLAQGLAPERVVFVDNASSDGSPERVQQEFPGVRVLCNERNLGYGHANNRGIELALAQGAEFVCLVNNDVTLEAGALAGLRAVLAREPSVGIVGPRVLWAGRGQRIWCAGGRLTFRANLSTLCGHGQADAPRFRETRPVDYVPGCAMLVRRAVFERAGLLEGDYFAYHEDLDFCLAARAQGFRTLLVGEFAAQHDAHSSTGGGYNAQRKYMMGVNTVWFLRRHGTPWRWLSFLLFDVCSLPFVWAFRGARGEGGAVLAKARGTWDGLRGRRVTPERLARLARGAGR
jgi:hypothetical protein